MASDATITGVTTGALSEDGAETSVSGTLTIADADAGEAVFQAVDDDALVTDYGTFTFNHETGAWSFTLNNDAAQALAEGEEVEQTLTVMSLDGSATQIITVTVTGANDAPTAAADGNTVSGDENTTITGTVPAGADVDGDALTYALVADVEGLTFNDDGTFSYEPAADFTGDVTFQYVVKDPNGGESEARTFTITVMAVNQAATIGGVTTGALTEDGAETSVSGTLTIADADAGEAVFQAVDDDALVTDYGTFTFNHETGAWSFTLNNDAAQALAEGEEVEQTLTVMSLDGSATQIITVTVTGANDAPTAAADGNTVSGDENTTITGTVPAGADVDGDALTYALVADVEGLTFNDDGTFSYEPAADFTGDVTFQYVVKDPNGGESEARTFTITVMAVNQAATIGGDITGALSEDGAETSVFGTLTIEDDDAGEAVFQAVDDDALVTDYGTFTFDADTGDWTFALNNAAAQSLKAGQTVEQTLTVKSHDGSATQTITVTVTGANDAPTAAAAGNSASGDEDKTLTGALPEAADVDGDTLTYELVAPVAGLTLNADGTFRYVPPADFNGNVVFQYVVKDPHGGESEARTFTLTIKPVNDAPRDITLSSSKVAENSAVGTEVGKLTVSDPEGGQFTYELVDSANGRFTIDTTGTLKVADGIKLDYEQATSHTIKIRVKDAAGATLEKSLTIDVTDVADETVTGTATDDVLKGGAGKDVFKGGLGNDMLSGGLGNDTLTGGIGKDVFIFDTKLGTSTTDRKVNFDKITDFSVKDDSIHLDNAIFKKLGTKGTADKPAQLSKAFFTIGTKAKDKNDYIVYNDKTGVLSYDADGSGKGKAVEFAQLSKKLALTNKDFFVV